MANITRKLTMTGQYRQTQRTGWGDEKGTAEPTPIPCLAYYGTAERDNQGRQFQQRTGWFVLLDPTMHTVKIGEHLDNIVDSQGVTLREKGVIEERLVYSHPRKGVQFVQVRLNDN